MRDHQRQPEDGDGRPEDEPDRDEGDVDRRIRWTPFVKNCLRVTHKPANLFIFVAQLAAHDPRTQKQCLNLWLKDW